MSRLVTFSAIAVALLSRAAAQAPPPVEYYRLVPGFLPENKDAGGRAIGTGFASPNPWGAYTAYLMATNGKGQRTWRIEDYLPTGNSAQGSTMYLLEGSERALLIDTAQNTQEVMGRNDLKTVVRYLLGRNNDGSVRAKAVDFVVANTHGHGDHTGKNGQMGDRTVYFPDLDWPNNAPPNYVPVREGGGATAHGSGTAAGEIALGDRTIRAINIYGHTRGSTGYLDAGNNLIATGDAIGSGYVWMHFGLISQYAESVRHLQSVLRPMHDPAILPAHFYQIDEAARGKPPIRGRPLDKQYVDDELACAEGVLDGSIVGEPYPVVGRNVAIARVDSAQMTYLPSMIYPAGAGGGAYRAIVIPGGSGLLDFTRYPMVSNIKTRFYLIRDEANNSMYLIVGSAKALLVGTGSGAPGLSGFVRKLAGNVPVEVIVTSDDPGQIGGLSQFPASKVYLPKDAAIPKRGLSNVSAVGQGDVISLGSDAAGRPATIQVEPLSGHSGAGLTLLDVGDRVLLSGDALGAQAADGGLILHGSLADFSAALKAWRARTDGRYDVVYTAHNFQWLTLPAFVDRLQNAVTLGAAGGDAALADSTAEPGYKVIRSGGAADVAASIVLAGASMGAPPR
jgi:glyoxylase-like metal-dependent hydrolase (beta-lactamase superfamily II)